MDYGQISEGLRNVLKTRNITYKDVAHKLDMSESGVKKMLTADDIAYNKLNSILEILDLSIEDLMPLAPKPYKKLTEEQEKFFTKNPQHFNFFIQLHHHRMKVELLKKSNNRLSKEKLNKFLEDLEKMKIIKQVDGTVHSLLGEGFRTSDKFNECFRASYEVVLKSLNKGKMNPKRSWTFEGFGTFNLSHKSALELRNGMQALLEEFSARSEREKKLYEAKDLVSTGTLLLNVPLKLQEIYPLT